MSIETEPAVITRLRLSAKIENQRIRRRLLLCIFFAGYAFGLAVEKFFILADWPDHAVSPAVVSALVGFLCAAGYAAGY